MFFTAVCGVSAYVPHRYHFVSERKTWTEAQSYCRQTYTDLATINNMDEMKKLNEAVKDKSVMVWIGLKKVTWQWSLQDGVVYREGQSYNSWTTGEPSSKPGEEMCVQLNGDGTWSDNDCSHLFPFVCFEGKQNRFVFINDLKSWHDAQSYCRQNYTDLASVRNQTENDVIKVAANGKTVWIGLFRVSWKWSDQIYSSFRYWKQNQTYIYSGNETCAHIVMTDGGYWNKANCETKFPFICYESEKSSYILIKEAKSWYNAQSYCRERYTDLVSVRNQTENQRILDLAKMSVNNSLWIGLFYDSWKWADQSASSFRYWASTQPDNCGGSQSCTAVFMAEQGRWHDMNSNSQLPFVCHERQLILINQNLTWREALRYCRDNHVDLLSVLSEEIQLWVKEVSPQASTELVWLGLRHTCAQGFWYWVSGFSICYENWAPGNGTGGEDCSPVERTGAVQSRGGQQWVSLPEDHKLNFICLTYEAVCGVSAYIPHRYHFVNESKTWTEAQSYCRQTYTDLATINNMDEMKKFNETVKDKYLRVWIGLEEVTWQWSLQDGTVYREGQSYINWHTGEPNSTPGEESYCRENHTDLASVRNQAENDVIKTAGKGKPLWIGLFRFPWKWSDQSYSSFRNWKQNQPDGFSGKENCGYIAITDGGRWNIETCETKLPFICYERKNSSYILIKEAKSWRDAQSYCRQRYTDLVSVRNQSENQRILDLAKMSVNNSLWIGLFYDSWNWADQSASSFRYWASTQPDNDGGNQNCTAVFMAEQGRWHDLNANTQLPFICHENQLILIKQSLTWREALRYCQVNHVDLVSVHSEEIQLWVKEVVHKASTEHVWLGLRHTCTLSFWYWVGGESICYQNWAPRNGTGGEDCSSGERTGAVQSRGGKKWVSLPEDHKLNFICTTYEEGQNNITALKKEEHFTPGFIIIHINKMDQKWTSVLFLLSAVCGVSAYVPHRYHFVNESETWTEAQSYCRQTYTDLATINNMDEMKKLKDTLKDGSLRVWIGLEKVTWQWSLQDGMVYREGQSYSKWNNGEPNSKPGEEVCVQLNGDGSWNDDDCSRLFSFVCFEERSSYVFIQDSKSWRDAQSYCRENHTDLASVRNQAENDEIKVAAKGKTVWIGLFRFPWKWSDQSCSSFRYWKQNRPDISSGKETCALIEMPGGGYWNYADCETKFPFICYEKENSSCMLIKEAKTWHEAQSYCRELYTDLVSVRNQTENQQILDLAKISINNSLWIGLFYDSWKWADQSASSFRYWASTEPDNDDGNQNCTAVFMAEQGRWHDMNSNSQLPFICHENQLILIKQNLSWREALRYCRDNHVDLVSVLSEEIQLWVKEVAQKASTEHVWLGLRHTCTLSFWFWVSGGSICYQNWAPGNGTEGEDCSSGERTGVVQSRGGQQWVSLPETQKLNFICTTYEDED
ncbi:hypothetical protein MHYP_G00091870 [Metynnis hypsauchen]